jgi:hypothetical protein
VGNGGDHAADHQRAQPADKEPVAKSSHAGRLKEGGGKVKKDTPNVRGRVTLQAARNERLSGRVRSAAPQCAFQRRVDGRRRADLCLATTDGPQKSRQRLHCKPRELAALLQTLH